MTRQRRRRDTQELAETIELLIDGADRDQRTGEGYHPVTIHTNRGDVEGRYYPKDGAIFVGGVGGGYDTPVRGSLYPDLCQQLPSQDRIACLRVKYRHPTELLEATVDVLAGAALLEQEGVERIALVGWSFGGAVVVQAAALAERVRTVVTIATQSYGLGPIAMLGPRCSVLLMHGKKDETLPVHCSEYGYQAAREPKRLMTHPEGNHGLDAWADKAPQIIRDWIRAQLAREPSET